MKPIPRETKEPTWFTSVKLIDAIGDEVNACDENNISYEEVDDVIKALVARGYCAFEETPALPPKQFNH